MIDVLLLMCVMLLVFELSMTAAASAAHCVLREREGCGGGRDNRLPSAAPQPVRASDEEREDVARAIGAAMAEGRLGLEEGIQRIEAAMAARYRIELDVLELDLPSSRSLGRGNPRGVTPPAVPVPLPERGAPGDVLHRLCEPGIGLGDSPRPESGSPGDP